jgi:hypothetical protein
VYSKHMQERRLWFNSCNHDIILSRSVHHRLTCNPSYWGGRDQEDWDLRPAQAKKLSRPPSQPTSWAGGVCLDPSFCALVGLPELGLMVHTCNPSTQEVEAGES